MLMLAIIAGGLELQGLLALPRGVAVGNLHKSELDGGSSHCEPTQKDGMVMVIGRDRWMII